MKPMSCVGACALWTVLATGALAQPRRHAEVVLVPAAKPPAVDGNLADWDLSGAIECAFDEALAPRFTMKFAAAYDGQALYVAAHFVDPTPLRNAHDPRVEPNRGWAGDCLQLRLCSDPAAAYPLPGSNSDRICHLTMWHFTGEKLPVLHVQYGMDYHGTRVRTGEDSGLAFRTDADGKGYTLEGRIPWALLNARERPPAAGDRIAMVLQPLWGDARGEKHVCTFNDVVRGAGFSFQGCSTWGRAKLSPKGNLPAARRPRSAAEAKRPLAMRLSLPDAKAKSFSAAVFSAAGELVRTLPVTAPPVIDAGGKVTVRWNGLDDDGRPLQPGRYAVKLLTHRGIGQRWVASLHNAGNPPWRTDDGTGSWGGDHGPPIAAASDGERVYLGWTISEAGWAVLAVKDRFTPAGKVQKLWGQHQVLEIGMHVTALAADGRYVFAAQDGRRWGQKNGGTYTAGVVLWDAKTGRPVNFPFGKRALVVSEWSDDLKPAALRAGPRLSPFHPHVPAKRFWQRHADHDFGPQELGWNLLGVAVVGERLYASLYLEDRVAVFDWRTGKKLRDVAIPRPAGLAADKAGRVLVACGRGVVRLSPDQDRAETVVSGGLKAPWGLAVGPDGRVFVADCAEAMCVKVFDTSGRPAGTIGRPGGRAWIGRYDPAGMLRPAGIALDAGGKLWVTEHDSTPKRVSVWRTDGTLAADLLGGGAYAVEGIADEANPRHVNVHHTLFDVDYATGAVKTLATLIRPQMRGFTFAPDGGYMGRALKVRHVRGRTYLVHAGRGGVVIYRLDDKLRGTPAAAMGPGNALLLHGFGRGDLPKSVREAFLARHHEYAYRWSDRNADGLVQDEELAVEKANPTWGLYWGSWVDDELTVWSAGRNAVWRVPVAEWTPAGVPVYPPPSEQRPLFEARGTTVRHVMPAGDTVYLLEQHGGDGRGGGADWAAVSRYTAAGKRLWAYRRAWLGFGLDAPLASPGDVVGAMKFIGSASRAGGPTLVGVNGYFGQFNLLSEDGLWVASLCKDNRYGPKADATTVWPENFSGCLYRHGGNDKVYLIAGDTDARIWEVTGLETIRTSRRGRVIGPAEHALARTVALQRQGLSAQLAPLRILLGPGRKIDGDLGDWDLSAAVSVDAGASRAARADLACDGERLLAAFDVADDSPMKNAGQDAGLLFKTGDVCEVMLATDAAADPKRKTPAAGDVRLAFAEVDGKGVCVLFEPVVRSGPKRPRTFSSPTGAVTFDRVGPVEGAEVAVRRSKNGYRLEAAVPLAAIGLSPKPGRSLRGDVGVIFSDAGGSRNVLRACYANRETAIVNDIPSEARLSPHRWGLVQVEESKR